MNPPAIRFEDVTISYDRHPAVHHFSGSFAPGSLTAVTGPNGAGKSTLVKALIGEFPRKEGIIDRGGLSVRDFGYLPQTAEIDRQFPLSVADTVMLGAWRETGAFGGATRYLAERGRQALMAVGLEGFERRHIGSLSAGQFQRILFARLLLQDAKVIVLDGPSRPSTQAALAAGRDVDCKNDADRDGHRHQLCAMIRSDCGSSFRRFPDGIKRELGAPAEKGNAVAAPATVSGEDRRDSPLAGSGWEGSVRYDREPGDLPHPPIVSGGSVVGRRGERRATPRLTPSSAWAAHSPKRLLSILSAAVRPSLGDTSHELTEIHAGGGGPVAAAEIEVEYMAAEPDIAARKAGKPKAAPPPGGAVVAATATTFVPR